MFINFYFVEVLVFSLSRFFWFFFSLKRYYIRFFEKAMRSTTVNMFSVSWVETLHILVKIVFFEGELPPHRKLKNIPEVEIRTTKDVLVSLL